jgi:hypothetical protein
MPATAVAAPPVALGDSRDFLIEFGLAKAMALADGPLAPTEPWYIYIKASTPGRDFEGQSILPDALKETLPYFMTNGRITYEHVTPQTRYDPSIIIGEPRDYRFDGNDCLLIKAELYKHQPKAQAVWDIFRSGGFLKASVGGSILRPPVLRNGVETITKVLMNHVALTPWPVNDDTNAQVMPYAEFMKALGAASAAPLVREDLDGATYGGTPELRQRLISLAEILQQMATAQGKHLSAKRARSLALKYMQQRGQPRHATQSGQYSL